MSTDSKKQDGQSGSADQPFLDTQTTPEESVICYQMQPIKRMLSESECSSMCHHGSAENNKMPPCLLSDQSHSVIDLEKVCRVGLMITPQARGDVVDQGWEAISTIRAVLRQRSMPMTVTSQNVFVRSAEDIEPLQQLFNANYRDRIPATNFIVQPPCGGQALAIEAWAIGGEEADVQFPQPNIVSIKYDGIHWVHVAGVRPEAPDADAYTQAQQVFDQMGYQLTEAGTSFKDVVRTWIYQGGITDPEDGIERYREMNRARTDFFDSQQALCQMAMSNEGKMIYPASTGIGMIGRELSLCAMTLQTDRDDVRLLPLENPQQTSAYDYAKSFSAKSPKFSRAMALVIGDYVTTWISGTASIVNSESVHLGDIEKQTEQTIDNIQNLISAENFERHGVQGARAELRDLAKVRVYVKHLEDFEKCRAICERRFGPLPTIYAQADVCRSDLLVEIEGVAFSQFQEKSVSQEGDH